MTLIEVNELFLYWCDHPPLQLMIQKFLGFDSSGKSSSGGGNVPHDRIVELSGGKKTLPNELRRLEKRNGS